MKTLTLAVKGIYFDQIRDGIKTNEYRLCTAYWLDRLENRHYDEVEITLGYPSRGDIARRLRFPYRGFRTTIITHEHFGPTPVMVLAIPLLRGDSPSHVQTANSVVASV